MMPSPAPAVSFPRMIAPHEIRRDQLLAITLHSGHKIAGRALSRTRETRSCGYVTVRLLKNSPNGIGNRRIEIADVATIVAAGPGQED